MVHRLIGAVLVIIGCGGVGCAVAGLQKREIRCLTSLLHALELMRCELEFRMTTLPQLCRTAGERSEDLIGRWFTGLAILLEQRDAPDIEYCIDKLETVVPGCYPRIGRLLDQLGRSLGRFDLSGQLDGIDGVIRSCMTELDQLTKSTAQRARSIRTLGFCAGTALAILLL